MQEPGRVTIRRDDHDRPAGLGLAAGQDAVVASVEAEASLLLALPDGSSSSDVPRRLDTTIAATMISTAMTEMVIRTGAEADSPMLNCTTAGAMSTDTRFITLISG